MDILIFCGTVICLSNICRTEILLYFLSRGASGTVRCSGGQQLSAARGFDPLGLGVVAWKLTLRES